MPEAVEIARLHLFLNLASSVTTVDELEPLPNIDFNLMAGNSLVGRVRLDEEEFARAAQSDLFRRSLPELLAEKRRSIESYRGASSYADDLRALRDGIEEQRAEARKVLDDLLLTDFQSLGVQFQQATWDEKKKTDGKPIRRALTYDDIQELQPFHWAYEFDEILSQGGFDVILTNPPWEIWKPQAKEFFAEHSELVTKNAMRIEDFEKERGKLLRDPAVRRAWLAYQSRFPHLSLYFRKSPQYPNQIAVVGGKKAGTDINLYKLFLERCFNLLCPGGACGIVIPSGIYTDLGTKQLREMLFTHARILGLFGIREPQEYFRGCRQPLQVRHPDLQEGRPDDELPRRLHAPSREGASRLPEVWRRRIDGRSRPAALARFALPDGVPQPPGHHDRREDAALPLARGTDRGSVERCPERGIPHDERQRLVQDRSR